MSEKSYKGSCHCGGIQYEARLDLDAGGGKCNCSICAKTRNWSASIKPEAFKLTKGSELLSDYCWGTESVHNYFCKTCGVRPFTNGELKELGGAFVSVRLNTLDLQDDELKRLGKAPVRFMDGRSNNWTHAPEITSYL